MSSKALDLNSLSDGELEAISNGDLDSLSDSTLELIANQGSQEQAPSNGMQDSTLPNLESTNQKIATREDPLNKQTSLLGFMSKPGALQSMDVLGSLRGRAEASIANPAIEMQKGNFDKASLLDSMIAGAKGNVLGQFGDLVRNTGVGGQYNELLASSTGLLATLGSPDILSGGKLTKGASKASNKLSQLIGETKSGIGQVVDDAIKNKTGFLEDVRSAFYEAKDTAVEKFGQGLDKLAQDNPQTQVNLRPVIDQLQQSIAIDPKIRNAVNKVQSLSAMLDEPKLANSVPLKDAQDIVNMVQSRVSSGKLRGVGVRPDDIPLLDVVHDMKYQMVDAFPQLKELRQDYGKTISKFNALRGKFGGIGSDALQKNVKSGFGGDESMDAVKDLLKDAPDILGRLKNYAALRKAGNVLSKTGVVAGLGTVGGAVISALKP